MEQSGRLARRFAAGGEGIQTEWAATLLAASAMAEDDMRKHGRLSRRIRRRPSETAPLDTDDVSALREIATANQQLKRARREYDKAQWRWEEHIRRRQRWLERKEQLDSTVSVC